MSEDHSNHLYNEKDISALLKRATELQEADSARVTLGLTLAEIEKIAAEVGIDPRYIQAAAVDLLRQEHPKEGAQLWGGPLFMEGGRLVAGHVAEEQWAEIVQEIRRAYGQTGRTQRLGNALDWVSPPHELEEIHVTLSPHEGHTRIQIGHRYEKGAVLYYLVVLGASIIGAGVLVESLDWPQLVELSLAGGGFGGFLALMRSVFGRWTRKQRRKLETLLTRLEGIIRETRPATAEEGIFAKHAEVTDEAAAKLRLPDALDDQQDAMSAKVPERRREGI